MIFSRVLEINLFGIIFYCEDNVNKYSSTCRHHDGEAKRREARATGRDH